MGAVPLDGFFLNSGFHGIDNFLVILRNIPQILYGKVGFTYLSLQKGVENFKDSKKEVIIPFPDNDGVKIVIRQAQLFYGTFAKSGFHVFHFRLQGFYNRPARRWFTYIFSYAQVF
jgi:hypothetical protein